MVPNIGSSTRLHPHSHLRAAKLKTPYRSSTPALVTEAPWGGIELPNHRALKPFARIPSLVGSSGLQELLWTWPLDSEELPHHHLCPISCKFVTQDPCTSLLNYSNITQKGSWKDLGPCCCSSYHFLCSNQRHWLLPTESTCGQFCHPAGSAVSYSSRISSRPRNYFKCPRINLEALL